MLRRKRHSALVALVLTTLAGPSPAAASDTLVVEVPWSQTFFVCDEIITLSGTLLIVSHTQDLKDGGLVDSYHVVPHLSGTSSSGAAYRWIGARSTTIVRVTDGVSTGTFAGILKLVSPTAGAETLTVTSLIKYTVDPNGNGVVSLDKYTYECR